MGNFDLFFDARESLDSSHIATTANISGATTLNPEGTNFTLASAVTFSEGQRVLIYDGVTGIAYATVVKVTDSTHIRLLPFQSSSDSVTLPYSFPNNSAIATQDAVAGRCCIDLSEAPEESYQYLVFGYGVIDGSGTPSSVTTALRLNVLDDDPFSGTGGYCQSVVNTDSTTVQRCNHVVSTSLSLTGGQKYSLALSVQSNTANTTATMSNPGLVVLRYTSGYTGGDGKTTEQTTTSTSYVAVTGLDLGANIPAGDYLIVSTWCATNSSTSNKVDVKLEADGSTILANQVSRPNVSSDYIPAGFCGVVTLGATNRVRLQFKASATTAKIKNAFLAAIPIANIPAIAGTFVSQTLGSADTQTVTDNNYVAIKTSGSVSLTSGRYLEVVSASLNADNPFRSRPAYDDEAGGYLTSFGNHNMTFGVTSSDYVPTFWFARRTRVAASSTNRVEMRRNTAVSTVLRARDYTFSWLREQADFTPLPDERMAVVADIEMGGRIYRSWNSTSTAGRYFKKLTDVTYISRVVVNDTEYTRSSTLGGLADGYFYWDSANSDLYVELPSTDTPADDDINVIVIPAILVAREKENLTDSSGSTLPYLPLLKDVPGSTQRLGSSDGKYETSTSLGSLKLVAADGRFDDAMLTPATFEGYYAKVRRGYTRQTSNLSDFEVVADATLGLASTDFSSLTLRLFDRRLLIQRPIATTKITVREGTVNTRDDQPLPILYGSLKRVIAYRIQNNLGGTDWNEFQFCPHGIKSISAVYLDGTTSKAITAGNLNVTSTYIDAGKVRVNNAAFPTATEPADVVYVDLIGSYDGAVSTNVTTAAFATADSGSTLNVASGANIAVGKRLVITNTADSNKQVHVAVSSGSGTAWTVYPLHETFDQANGYSFPTGAGSTVVGLSGASNTASTGVALRTPGAIARHLLTTYGGTRAKHLVESSFRMIDRAWRYQINSGVIPTAPLVGLIIDDSMNAEDALATLCDSVFAFYKANRQGRIALDVPDLTVGNLCVNGGFESVSGWPWKTMSSATLAVTSSRKYDGLQSAEITNGSPTDSFAYVAQTITIPSSGTYAVTLLAALIAGKATRFRIGIVGPSGNESLTDNLTIQTGSWTRLSFVYTASPGEAGHAELRIYPAYNSSTATTVAVDSVELYKVAAVIDRSTSTPTAMSFLDEHYYEAAVTYAVNPEASDRTPKRVIADAEARGLSASLPSEGMYSNRSAKRLDVETLATDGPSAAGIGAPIIVHYSRQRHQIEAMLVVPTRIPLVGEYLYHQLNPRIPEMPNGYPIWRITEVRYDDANAKVIKIKAQRQQDPVIDRISIAPDAIPMGGVAITTTTSATSITDYDESTDLGGDFVMGSTTVDLTQAGSLYHTHDLSHTHPVASHTHTASSISVGSESGDSLYERYGPVGAPTYYVARGLGLGGHTHTPLSSSVSVASATGTSAVQSGALATVPGPNEPSYRRVRFMVRTANTVSTISQNLIVGYRSATIPAGWSRVTDLDGYYLRAATSNAAVSTNVATSSFTTSDSGSTLNVASGTNISVGKRLEITNTADSNKKVHVVVTAGSGTAWTVYPLHETSDQANGYSFPSGAGSTVVGDSEAANTAYTAATHSHTGTMPSHTHAGGGHTHGASSPVSTDSPSDAVSVALYGVSPGLLYDFVASDTHVHSLTVAASVSDGTSSSSAGGTITSDVANTPPYYELVFITPSDANQKVLPTGAILFWVQSDDAPYGYAKLGEAAGMLIRGAPTSPAVPGSSVDHHVHSQADSQHTYAHSHGGAYTGTAGLSSDTLPALISRDTSYTSPSDDAHDHDVSAVIGSTSATMSANSAHDTAAATDSLPTYRKIILIQKQ